MKAMALREISPISSSPLILEKREIPAPKENELLIRVSCCAVCRTDLHVIEGDLPPKQLPLIPGHQIVGIVEKRGEHCARINLGDRVGAAWLRHTCGECEFCRSNRENLCPNQQFTGYHADGGYAEYAIVPEDFAYPIPTPLSDEQAAPLLCAGIIGYRSLKRAECPPNGKIGLYGFGSSAHIICQIARHRGLEVYAISRTPDHQALALKLGATWAGPANAVPVPLDSAIIFAPVGELVPVALRQLKRGGTLALAGIHMSDIPSMSYEDHLFYEKNIHSVTANTRQDGLELLQEAADASVKAEIKIYSLDQANQALQDLKSDKINGTGLLTC